MIKLGMQNIKLLTLILFFFFATSLLGSDLPADNFLLGDRPPVYKSGSSLVVKLPKTTEAQKIVLFTRNGELVSEGNEDVLLFDDNKLVLVEIPDKIRPGIYYLVVKTNEFEKRLRIYIEFDLN